KFSIMEVSGTANSDTADWHQWCRLCAKVDVENKNVYFKDGHQTWTSVLAVAIGKYFWVNIKMEDELSNALCKECCKLVERLIEFSERVNRVQTLYSRLQAAAAQSNKLDYEELRRDCGFLEDNWNHIIADSTTEEKCIEKIEEATMDYFADEMVESVDQDVDTIAEIETPEFLDNDDSRNVVFEEEHEVNADEYIETEPAKAEKTDMVIEQEKTQEEEQAAEDEFSEIIMTDEEVSSECQYKCTSCSKEYKKPMAYKRHMAEVHGLVPTDMPDLECKRCQSRFSTEHQLTAHYRTHLPAKEKADNACSYCSKLFTTAGALKRHILSIHENVKPYICDCCGNAMKTVTALNEHKLVHTDECPYECSVCHRRFKNMARLKIHSDTHTTNNYECSICGLRLNTRRTLTMHQLVHTDEKQYKCDVCGAAFKRGKTLKAHLILHTGIRPYKCNFCGKDFSNGSNCRMHKRKTHPNELAEEESRGVVRSTLLPMITDL
ncbi:CG6254, partial [Drosophila busckii]